MAHIFPATKASLSGRLLSEYNLTKMIHTFLDTECFVSSTNLDLSYPTVLNVNNDRRIFYPITYNTLGTNDTPYNFVLSGYQFSLGTISNTISLFNSGNTGYYSIQINLDTTVGTDRQLSGQTEQLLSQALSWTSYGTSKAMIDSSQSYLFTDYDIKSIVITHDTETYSGSATTITSGSSTNYIITAYDSNYTEVAISTGDTITVNYYDYSVCYNLISPTADDINDGDLPNSTGTSQESYILKLFYCDGNNWYIPAESLNKFNSTSISNIDGGIV